MDAAQCKRRSSVPSPSCLLQQELLGRHQRCVPPTGAPQQLLVAALLHHLATLQHHNLQTGCRCVMRRVLQLVEHARLPCRRTTANCASPHLVRILHGGQAVRNHHHSAPLHQLVNGSLRRNSMDGVGA